jgi:hypothetical protein
LVNFATAEPPGVYLISGSSPRFPIFETGPSSFSAVPGGLDVRQPQFFANFFPALPLCTLALSTKSLVKLRELHEFLPDRVFGKASLGYRTDFFPTNFPTKLRDLARLHCCAAIGNNERE